MVIPSLVETIVEPCPLFEQAVSTNTMKIALIKIIEINGFLNKILLL